MAADFIKWRSKQTIWMRAATSRPWEIGAKLLTPMHKLRERAMCCFLTDLFSNRIDPNDPPRWFEVLTLGVWQRKWIKPEPQASGGSSDVAAMSRRC